jgi:hypothetical protein
MIIANNILIPTIFMQKIILFLYCFMIGGFSYAQPLINNDSVLITTSSMLKAKEYTNVSPALTVYPNPAKNKITLQVKNFDPGMVSVKVLNIKGELVRADNRLLTNGSEEVVMFLLLKAGVYFIQVSQPGKMTRKKIVVL